VTTGIAVTSTGGSPLEPAAEAGWPPATYAWYVSGALALAYCFSFIDRQILNLLVIPIQQDLGVSDTQMSLLQGLAFALLYVTLGVPFGMLADRWNRRNLIVAGVTVWSVMTALCGLADSFSELFLARIGVGIGEAVLTPAAMSLLSDYFPKHKLARAAGVYTSGSSVGATLALLIGGTVASAVAVSPKLVLPLVGEIHSWGATFIIVGLPGIVVVALLMTVREPVRRGTLAVEGAAARLPVGAVLQLLWAYRGAYGGLYLALALQILLTYAMQSWIPTYFMRVHGWSMSQLGIWYGLVIFFGSVPGLMFGAWLGDRLVQRGQADGHIRVALLGCTLSIVPCVLTPLVPDPFVAMLLLGLSNFFFSFAFGVGPAALQIMTPNQLRAQVAAIYVLCMGLIGLLLGPTSVALLTDYAFRDPMKVGYSISVVAAVTGPLSAALLFFARGPYRRAIETAGQWVPGN
jgi:MFS family permease